VVKTKITDRQQNTQHTQAAPTKVRRPISDQTQKQQRASKESRNNGEGRGHVAHYYYRYGRHRTWRKEEEKAKADPAGPEKIKKGGAGSRGACLI
jgi:hypothetical protein